VDVPIVGELKLVLMNCSACCAAASKRQCGRYGACGSSGRVACHRWRVALQEFFRNYQPQFVIEKLHEITAGCVHRFRRGQHQMWAAQYYKFDKPRR